MNKRKKALIWAVCILAVFAFIISPPAALFRSMAVMSVYSGRAEKSSLNRELGLEIDMPSGEGWYPFVMTYNADESFERLLGQEGARLTILYNFPAYDPLRGCSRLFDTGSPYYNSFYGAYLVKLPGGGSYGFEPEGISLESALADIARLDFFGLVLEDFGLPKDERVFEHTVDSEAGGLDFLGFDGWTRVDARLKVNGAGHEAAAAMNSYWQYGRPDFPVASSFVPVEMECTVLARYFEELDTTLFFYVMASSCEVRDDCVDSILPRTVLRISQAGA